MAKLHCPLVTASVYVALQYVAKNMWTLYTRGFLVTVRLISIEENSH